MHRLTESNASNVPRKERYANSDSNLFQAYFAPCTTRYWSGIEHMFVASSNQAVAVNPTPKYATDAEIRRAPSDIVCEIASLNDWGSSFMRIDV